MSAKKILLPTALGSILPFASWAQTAQQPNIIFFLVDDMGWQETSVPFYKTRTLLNNRYRTPNMERLAAMGTRFTNAYACSVSSPSRCSLMSGMNAARHRVTNWVGQHNVDTNCEGGLLTLPEWNYNGLQPVSVAGTSDTAHAALCTPLPQLLHDAGYYTIHCGKGNIGAGNTPGARLIPLGFDVNIAGSGAGAPASYLAQENYGSGFYHVGGLEEYYEKGTFLTEALTLEAIKAMRKPIADHKPFFLYMSHYAIHVPYQADERFTSNYMIPGTQTGVFDAQLGEHLNRSEINHAALLEGMDKSLGDLLDFIGQNDSVARNTIVIFMSDNGGQATHVRQGREAFDQNYPARGGKGSAYDGGVHEPMMVSWPGVTQGGTVNSNRVIIEDFFPTILSMAGVKKYSTFQTVDGRDFSDLLTHPERRRDRVCVWHYPNRWTERTDDVNAFCTYSALMKGDYHLIYLWEKGELRLYNIESDPFERKDLAEKNPKMLRRMARQLTRELKSMNAQRPVVTATGKPAPWPDEVN